MRKIVGVQFNQYFVFYFVLYIKGNCFSTNSGILIIPDSALLIWGLYVFFVYSQHNYQRFQKVIRQVRQALKHKYQF